MIIDINREDERKIYEVYKLLDKYLNKTKQQILDKEEKEYLEAVSRPFKNRIIYISKLSCLSKNEYIRIAINNDDVCVLPYFKAGEMYKGMEADKKYTLKELGLFTEDV